MSLANATLTSGGTISVAGGSTVTFATKQAGGGKLETYVPADTDFRLRRTATFQAVDPKVDTSKPNGYTQAKSIATFTKPKLLANGKYTKNTIQVSLFFDPETTAAEKQELLDFAAQCAFDPDITTFMKDQSLA